MPIGDLDPDGSDTGGSSGSGGTGNSGRCSTPVASRPFSLDDWPAVGGTFPLAITGIAFDPSGNLGVTGYTASDVDLGGGVLRSGGIDDLLLAKYDAAGNHTLSKLFGDDSGPQAGHHVVFDADCNMFLVRMLVNSSWDSISSHSIFLDKLDSAGTPLWSKHLNAGYEADWNVRSIAVDPTTGGVVLVGRYYGDFDLGGGRLPLVESGYDPYSGYVAKFDAMGDFVWSDFAPSGSGRYMPGGIMAVDASGHIVIAADDSDIDDDGSGKFARFRLARLDASGNDLWSNVWTAPLHRLSASDSHEGLAGIAVDGDGSVFLAGNAHCDFDFGGGPLVGADCSSDNAFVAKFDARGGHIWSRVIAGSSASKAVSLGVDALGNTFVAGTFTGTLDADGTALGAEDGAERRFVVRLDGDGHISWSQTLGPELSNVLSLAVDPGGNVAILGEDDSGGTGSPLFYRLGGNVVTKLNVAAP